VNGGKMKTKRFFYVGVLILLLSLVIFGIGVGAEPAPQPVRPPIYEAFVPLDDADLHTASLVGGNIVYAAICEQSDVQAILRVMEILWWFLRVHAHGAHRFQFRTPKK
jgi:hypothetical protein